MITLVLKPKVSVFTLSNGIASRHTYNSNIYSQNIRENFVFTCRHCRRLGQIILCFINLKNPSVRSFSKKGKLIKIWIERFRLRYNVILSILSTSKTDLRYLDSKCSKDMLGNKALFTSLAKSTKGRVTFGDDPTIKIYSKDIMYCVSIPTFKNVLFNTGLEVNSINISRPAM